MSSKIGILSDIHGNYNALKAVINKARKNKITSFIFCGDLIGYYYEPKKCLDLLSKLKVDYIKGNHEIMLDDYLNNKKPVLLGKGSAKRNYIFVEDAAKIIINLIKK